jgi:protein TonB
MKNQILFLLFFLCIGTWSFAQVDIDNSKTTATQTPIYKVVEQNAEYPGGIGAMSAFLRDNLKYPSEAKEKHAEGRVFMSFVIETNGKLTDIKILKDKVGYGAGEEAKRVVSAMPDWKPALQDGKAVRCQYTLPITFKL